MEDIPIDIVIGQNLAQLRIGNGTKHRPDYSQTRIAEYLRTYTGDYWDQSEVSGAERGERRFTVADLLVLGFVLQVSPIRLMHSGKEIAIWFGGIGIPEGDLLEAWLFGPRGQFHEDRLQTTWHEPDPQRTWATDRLTNAMNQEKEDTDGDD